MQVHKHAHELGVPHGSFGLAGDSAGGNLTAAFTLRALSDTSYPRLDYQILLCPVSLSCFLQHTCPPYCALAQVFCSHCRLALSLHSCHA